MPEGTTKEQVGREAPLVVSITSGNEIFIDKQPVRLEALKKELAQKAHAKKASGLLVRADKSASVDTLVRVLDAAKQMGIQKLGVAMDANF